MHNDPLSQYQQATTHDHYHVDPAQAKAIQLLQTIYEDLLKPKPFFWQKKRLIKGAYLWGNVGAGKTWLMDLFFNALPFPEKTRLHFHTFMRNIHEQLKHINGKANPLRVIAKAWANKTRVLCLDEFIVEDIADAMILGNLLDALFEAGVMLVTTSNTQPLNLYANGLQRARFLPAIALLEKNTHIMEVASQTDYRLRKLTPSDHYFTPLNSESEQHLEKIFQHLIHHGHPNSPQKTPFVTRESLYIEGREIPVIKRGHDVAWFEFDVLCHIPRATRDYVSIAETFPYLLLSHVPELKATDLNATTYFIQLIDVLYDQKTKLFISAEIPLMQLYPEGPLEKTFARTRSRLIEMQSQTYLQTLHRL